MYKKFQANRTKIKGGCQSETKAAHCYSSTDLTLKHHHKKELKTTIVAMAHIVLYPIEGLTLKMYKSYNR